MLMIKVIFSYDAKWCFPLEENKEAKRTTTTEPQNECKPKSSTEQLTLCYGIWWTNLFSSQRIWEHSHERSNKGRARAVHHVHRSCWSPISKNLWLYFISQTSLWGVLTQCNRSQESHPAPQNTGEDRLCLWKAASYVLYNLTLLFKLTSLLCICRTWLKAHWGGSL